MTDDHIKISEEIKVGLGTFSCQSIEAYCNASSIKESAGLSCRRGWTQGRLDKSGEDCEPRRQVSAKKLLF